MELFWQQVLAGIATGAISMPAIEPIAAAMPQPSAFIQPTRTPTSRAETGLAAAARIDRPTRVKRKKKYRKRSRRMVTLIIPA